MEKNLNFFNSATAEVFINKSTTFVFHSLQFCRPRKWLHLMFKNEMECKVCVKFSWERSNLHWANGETASLIKHLYFRDPISLFFVRS